MLEYRERSLALRERFSVAEYLADSLTRLLRERDLVQNQAKDEEERLISLQGSFLHHAVRHL